MNFTSQLFSSGFPWFFWPLLLFALWRVVLQTPWRTLIEDTGLQHRFLGFTLGLVVMWQMSIDLNVGIVIHFIGLTTMTLLFGWPLAVIAGLTAQAVDVALLPYNWPMFAYNSMLNVLLPVCGTWWLYQWVERRKPNNPFIFILGVGFFGCALTITLSSVLALIMLKLFGQTSMDIEVADYLGYLPIFVFPEAVINGMFVSAITILHPDVVATFDDERYFKHDKHHMILDEHIEPALDLEQTEAPDEQDDSRYRPPKEWYEKDDDK